MRKTLLIPALLCAGLACSTSLAADVPQEVKSEFHLMRVKRDKCIRELAKLDGKAADAKAAGKTPTALNAEQTALQEKADLYQKRLEHMAMRWNLDIPAPPKPGTSEMDEGTVTQKRFDAAFAVGAERTDEALRDRCRQMLASIDYDSFLRRAD